METSDVRKSANVWSSRIRNIDRASQILVTGDLVFIGPCESMSRFCDTFDQFSWKYPTCISNCLHRSTHVKCFSDSPNYFQKMKKKISSRGGRFVAKRTLIRLMRLDDGMQSSVENSSFPPILESSANLLPHRTSREIGSAIKCSRRFWKTRCDDATGIGEPVKMYSF